MDELVLKLVTKVNDAKSSISSMINLTKNLDNTTSKTTQSFDKMSNSTSKISESFKKPVKDIQDLENELKSLTKTYNKELDVFKYGAGKNGIAGYNPSYDPDLGKIKTDAGQYKIVTQQSLNEQLSRINELQQAIDNFYGKVEQEPSSNIADKVSPKEIDTKPLDDLKKKTEDANKKLSKTASLFRTIGNVSKFVATKGFDVLKNKFGGFSNGFGKGITNNINQLKKLALGLIGVRTAMSVLTKAVNSYLSFDSELQDSLTNSWNTLGALLAPAIEMVAHLFAMATNYVAQFVNALTGINLVARANAKALETQAKANMKANNAQRGLLGMDEITNLPTESSTNPANQISIDDSIKSFKLFDDLLNDVKNKDWHELGEDIGDAIEDTLSSINWDKIQKTAYNVTYNFADFLNGLFEVDWSLLGGTLSEVVNTWISFIGGFVDKFSFIQLGVGLGDALETFITDINWEELGQNITKGLDGLFQGILAFLETTDWSKIGEGLGDFIRNIDWGKLLLDLIKILGALLKGIGDFLAGFIASFYKDLSDESKQSIINVMDTIYDIINGAIQSFVDLFRIPMEFLGAIFKDLIDGIKLLLQGDLLGAVKKIGKALVNAFILPLNIFITGLNIMLVPLRAIIVALGKATGNNWTMNDIRIPTIPKLETGTPNIETEGLYHLHEGEMVVPKRYNPNTNGYNDGSDNKQIIDLLVSLNSSMLEYAERPINISMNGRQVAEASYNDFQEVSRNRNQSTAVTRS